MSKQPVSALESLHVEGAKQIVFWVSGAPKSTQTGGVMRLKGSGRLIPSRKGTAWSAVVGEVARRHAPKIPWEGPIEVWMTFHLKAPKKPKQSVPISRPDIGGNMEKGLLDSLNGVLWQDDCQMIDFHSSKRYAFDGRVGVLIKVRKV